jgi:hypothetical protein
MTGSSVYSNMKPSCLHIKVKIKIELMEINSERHSQAEMAQNRVHWWVLVLRALKLRVLLRESYLISNTDFMELCFQEGVDGTGSGPSSMAGFEIKGAESSGSGIDVVVC